MAVSQKVLKNVPWFGIFDFSVENDYIFLKTHFWASCADKHLRVYNNFTAERFLTCLIQCIYNSLENLSIKLMPHVKFGFVLLAILIFTLMILTHIKFRYCAAINSWHDSFCAQVSSSPLKLTTSFIKARARPPKIFVENCRSQKFSFRPKLKHKIALIENSLSLKTFSTCFRLKGVLDEKIGGLQYLIANRDFF